MKQIIDSIKDLVTDCNLDCSAEEISIQSMDSAHVSLVAVRLSNAAFDHFRCDRPNQLGINTTNLAKIFKMLNNDDMITLKAEDNADTLTMMFEGGKNDTIADFGKFRYKIVWFRCFLPPWSSILTPCLLFLRLCTYVWPCLQTQSTSSSSFLPTFAFPNIYFQFSNQT